MTKILQHTKQLLISREDGNPSTVDLRENELQIRKIGADYYLVTKQDGKIKYLKFTEEA